VNYSNTRGYYLHLQGQIDILPSRYIQAVQNRQSISCSSVELNALSDRAMESINQALGITNELVQSLLEVIRQDIDYLFSLVDSVVSTTKHYHIFSHHHHVIVIVIGRPC